MAASWDQCRLTQGGHVPGSLPIRPKRRCITPSSPQNVERRDNHRGQRCSFGLLLTGTAALYRLKPLVWSGHCATNPIGCARVSGLAQSGFNEVAHSARPDPQRRATSQNPPDSRPRNNRINLRSYLILCLFPEGRICGVNR